jgi:beta-glucanase (GH16 family)
MKTKSYTRILLYCLLLLVVLAGCSQAGTPKATPIKAPDGWKLVWQDEFNEAAGAVPDPSKWIYDLGGHGWGNKEYQYYTDKPENAATDGLGSLVITAQKTDPSTSQDLICWYGSCDYTSARLLTKTKFEFTYGRVEARVKMAYGQGLWSAFWLLGANIDSTPWPNCGEIDILENIGKEPSTIHGTVHGPGYSGANGIGGPYTLSSGKFADDFHTFAVEWDPQEIRWFVDGEQYFSVDPGRVSGDWVFDHPFFMILNLAVGGNWPGYPDTSTVFPQTMTVDYVRVFQKDGN